MTNSRGLARPRAAASVPAHAPTNRLSSSLVGWLVQTAFIAVVEGTCETYYESRGSNVGPRRLPTTRRLPIGRFVFPLNFHHYALISKVWGRESKLSTAGHVAGLRRRRRAVLR